MSDIFTITLYGQPVTKKNSSMIIKGKSIILPSPAYRAYEADIRSQLSAHRLPHYTGGVWVTALYYLKNKSHWPDLTGLMQATADIISDEYKVVNHKRTCVREWIIADDGLIKSWDCTKIAGIDANNPRVVLTITPKVDADEINPLVIRASKER